MGSKETAALDPILVPLKPRVYRGYCNINAFTAVFIAALLALLCCTTYGLLYKGFTIPVSAGWLGCLFFFLFCGTVSGMMLWSLTSLVRRMNKVLSQNLPALAINQDGIIDNASDNPNGLICWDQIEQITLTKCYGNGRKTSWPGVAILLNAHNRPRPGPMMLFFGLDVNLPVRQVFIRQEMIGKPASEVVKMANEFRARMTQ